MDKTASISTLTVQVRASLVTYKRWKVSVTNDSDPLFSFEEPAVIHNEKTWREAPKQSHDIFIVRDALFRVDDAEEALAFFKKYGPLRLDRRLLQVRLSEVRFIRDIRKEFLLRKTTIGDFRRQGHKESSIGTVAALFDAEAEIPPPLLLTRARDSVAGTIECGDVYGATLAAVYMDRLTGFGWDECEECGMPYKRTTRHKRKFCGKQCLTYSTTQKSLNPHESVAERRARLRRRA